MLKNHEPLTTHKLLIVAILCLGGCAWIGILFAYDYYSYGPIPSRWEIIADIEQKSQDGSGSTAPHQLGPHGILANGQDVITSEEQDHTAWDRYEHYEKAFNDRSLVTGTYFVAGFTFLLVCVVIVQAMLFIEQLRIMRAEIGHTKRVVKAAEDQAITAYDTMILTQKLWICAQPWPPTVVFDLDGNIRFQMQFHSYGKAPALITELHIEYTDKPPSSKIPTYSDTGITPIGFVLAPDNNWWHHDWFGTTTKFPVVLGYVKYIDQFQCERISRFCYEFLPHGRVPTTAVGNVAWSKLD